MSSFSISKAKGVTPDMQYIDRGDPKNPDFTEGTLTLDEFWHDLDLSSIVPEASANHLVDVIITIKTLGAGTINGLILRKKGNSNEKNVVIANLHTSDYNVCHAQVMMNANRIIEYKCTVGIALDVTIRGWFI